jgi:transcriptional regulator with XRE-family HTH domain
MRMKNFRMEYGVPTEVLKFARESADVKQSALAKKLDTNPSVISRLERSVSADGQLAARYLHALNTPLAADIIEFYERPWGRMDPPSFLHPNREELWTISQSLKALDEFERSPANAPILRGSIILLREDLNRLMDDLSRLEHTIAWIGDIGVGKTTALAFATSILITDGKGLPKPVFPTGAGRTTVCETVIKAAPAYGVGVEALTEDEVRSLTRDLVMGLTDGPYGVSAEVGRVLRNMSGMRIARVLEGEKLVPVDPIRKLLSEEPDVDRVVDSLVAAMNLPARNETQLVLSEEAEHGQDWLAETITAINNGQHERFSVPRRINVLLPSPILTRGGIKLNIVDTKGIEGTTQRADLRQHLDDPRTLVVLCAKFPDAPSATVQRILKENEDAGSDSAKKGRICILALPRADEPMQISGDGQPVSSSEEGIAIRSEEIAAALRSAALPDIPTVFFDALKDKPDQVWSSLMGLVIRMRDHHVERLARTVRGVDRLINDVDLVKSEAARAQIEIDALRLIELIAKLPSVKRHAHENLMTQFDLAHQSSIAASVNRRGDWGNFPVLHILGIGVRNDANLRVAERFDQIDHTLRDWRLEHSDVLDVVQDIDAILARTSGWRQDYLAMAQSIGRDAFRNALERDSDLWRKAAERYGDGPGYKKDLAIAFKDFFERDALDDVREGIDRRLDQAWKQIVLEPLRETTQAAPST